MNYQNHISLFKSFFQGRQDVYAVRWEKDGKSGYMPAYKVDWSDYNKHKAAGGSFKDYSKKEYLPFSEDAIMNHLIGKETVGIYPLLEDNTSLFIAADFDEENWKDSILKLHQTCSKFEIPSYIERSRSGNGGHLWIFFEENFPAEQSRKLMFELLREATIISHFEKEPSFDRLFPNQDFHSGKGLGNLIALPLNGKTTRNGNSMFLDTETFEPFTNQFETIAGFKKLSKDKFFGLYEGFFNQKPHESIKSNIIPTTLTEIEIQISNQVYLKRFQLNKKLIAFLRDNLNFLNSDYLVKKNMGKSTFNIEKYFRLIEETTDEVIIPRGFVAKIVNFCKQESISFKVIDNRKKLDFVEYDSEIELLPHQEAAIEKIAEKDFGVIVSPPGSGKTIIGLEIIAQKRQPALIVVHRKQLFDQWIERIQSFLKIPKREIGQIGNQKFTIGKEITVAMIQSLTRREEISKIVNRFKTILVLTERKAHVDILNLYLKDKFETITIHGDDSEQSRKSKLEQLKQGHYKIVISTGQYFGEGVDISNLECLFITYPFAFEGKLVQYIGRIQRSGKPPVIFDYRDAKIDYFDKMFKQRNRYYKKLLK